MAQAALALLYSPARIYKTDVLQVDKEKSDYWRRRSAETARILAENGQSHAQCWLASCYMTGEGVERDWDKAIHWARQAAIRGSYRAIDLLTTLYKGKARESGEHVGHDHAIYKSDAMKFTDEYLDRQKGRFRLTMNIDFFDW
jgi:hypothetical protein